MVPASSRRYINLTHPPPKKNEKLNIRSISLSMQCIIFLLCSYFDKNGQLIYTEEYKMDNLHGKKNYYTNGKIIKTEHYYFDDFIK